MRVFTNSFIQEKNRLEGERAWTHLLEVVINVNTTGFFTTSPETITYSGTVYAPIPAQIGIEEQNADGSLPVMFVDVANLSGKVFRMMKDNDLSMNTVTIRLVNLAQLTGGDEATTVMQITGTAFSNEIARFNLSLNINFEAEGPVRTYNRRSFPGIPFSFRQFGLIS